MDDFTLWVKSYDDALTKLLLCLVPEFKILERDKDSHGCVKLGFRSPSFSHSLSLVRRLKNDGVLTKCVDEEEIVESCVVLRFEQGINEKSGT